MKNHLYYLYKFHIEIPHFTPNTIIIERFYIVDAVGATVHEKHMSGPGGGNGKKTLPLKELLERLAHNEISDEDLWSMQRYCSTIDHRYENDVLFGRHLIVLCYTMRVSVSQYQLQLPDKEVLGKKLQELANIPQIEDKE